MQNQCFVLISGYIGVRLLNPDVCFQAFAVIAASPLQIDLSCVLEHVITELTAFLRKVCATISLPILLIEKVILCIIYY